MNINWKDLSKKDKLVVAQLVIGASIIGLLITIYIVFLSTSTIVIDTIGQNRFIILHTKYPLIYLAWGIPILLGFTSYYFATTFISKKKEYDSLMEQKNAIITNNALFAKSIGEGDFSQSGFGKLNRNDLLTKSLLMMRNNLFKNKKNEDRNTWINLGKELISSELRKTTDLKVLSEGILQALLGYSGLIQGRFFIWSKEKSLFELKATYAYNRKKHITNEFKMGEGLIGTSAYEQLSIYRTEIPEQFTSINSGLINDKKPGSIFIMPLISEEEVQGILEVANISNEIPSKVRKLIEELGPVIAQVLFSVKVNLNTEKLLSEAQILTEELRENEEELQQNAEEMQVTHEELEKSNLELEKQINEVEVSKSRLHSLLENASEVISIFDSNGIVKYESPSSEAILGYHPEDVIGSYGIKRVEENFINIVIEQFKELNQNPKKSVNYTFKHLKKDGSSVWVETTGRNMLDNPAIKGIIFNTRDITLQRIAEKDKRLKSQMQALSENSPDLIIRFGRTQKIHYSNPKTLEYFGLKPKDIQGKIIKETKLKRDFKTLFSKQVKNTIINNRKLELEFETIINKKNRTFKISTIPEYNEEKELETVLLVAHDLTDIKAIEKEISEKNHKLTESINYAERIQTAILPKENILNQYFSDSFIYYKARDVVSGDYPWFKQNENGIYLAAVDCTGHGVPGALLSFVGYFLLNDIVNTNAKSNSAQLLDTFDNEVKRTLQQENGGRNTHDGMDIALCKFSLDGKSLSFAGAHRPLYILRGEELIQIKGNRRPIGGIKHKKKKLVEFTNHQINIYKGDKIFIFSDGISDQFKEGTLEKFQEKRVRKILIESNKRTMSEIHEVISTSLETWQGNYRQIDDMLLIGIEI